MAGMTEYVPLQSVDQSALLRLMNRDKVRSHLVDFEQFNDASLSKWIDHKIQEDARSECRIRAVKVKEALAGWCGIQHTHDEFELAIILDDAHWGIGRAIFRDMMIWARELGHKEIAIHLLDSRPEYRFLKKRAKRVVANEILGRMFTTYYLTVE